MTTITNFICVKFSFVNFQGGCTLIMAGTWCLSASCEVRKHVNNSVFMELYMMVEKANTVFPTTSHTVVTLVPGIYTVLHEHS